MQKYIFSIGLIPVQEFISQARRSRDLRAGSAILSWIMTEMLEYLTVQLSIKLIIPEQGMLTKSSPRQSFSESMKEVGYSFPSRASGTFMTDDQEGIDQIFKSLPGIMRAQWNCIFEESFTKNDTAINLTGDYHVVFQELFRDSSTVPSHVLWVVKKFDERDCIDAKEAQRVNLEGIEKLYVNMKRSRPITLCSGGRQAEKCSQCGQRELPVPVGQEAHQFYEKLSGEAWVRKGYRFDQQEKLCAVCLAKRFAGYVGGVRFPSTHRVAAADWIHHIQQHVELREKYEAFKKAAKELREDESTTFLYSSDTKKLKNVYSPNLIEKMCETRKNLYEAVKNQKDTPIPLRPSNYLSVIVFDGDGMGEKIRQYNNILPSQTAIFAKEALAKFKLSESSYLAEFFYCGGDEGVLLCPVSRMLNTVMDMRALFTKHVSERVDPSITLSFGVCIFHYERPMGRALITAHEALQKVKKKSEGKNSLAITVQTASGNLFTTVARWNSGYWERILKLYKLINSPPLRGAGRLASGWAYEVESFLEQLPIDELKRPSVQIPVTAEIRRITYRKLEVPGNSPLRKQQIWRDLNGDKWLSELDNAERESLTNQFHLLAFLARESQFLTEKVE